MFRYGCLLLDGFSRPYIIIDGVYLENLMQNIRFVVGGMICIHTP